MVYKKKFEEDSRNDFHSKYRTISTISKNDSLNEKILNIEGDEIKDISKLKNLSENLTPEIKNKLNNRDINDLSPELLAEIDSGAPPQFDNSPNNFWSVPIQFVTDLLIYNFILDVSSSQIGTDFKILYREINTPSDIDDKLPNDSPLFTLLQQGTLSSDLVSVIIDQQFNSGLYEFRFIGAFVDGSTPDFNNIISSDDYVKIYGGKYENTSNFTTVFTLNYFLDCAIINQSTILTQADLPTDDACWPILINGGTSAAPVTVKLAEDIVLTGPNRYFIIGSDYVNFDGADKNVTIKDINNYPGLFNNGDSSNNGFSNVNITNVNVKADNSTLIDGSGWVVQQNFAKAATNVVIDNCSSNGNLTNFANAGIAGSNLAINGGEVIVRNCHASGNIYAASHGLISNDCGNNGYVLIENCYTTGNILSQNSAGLVGQICASNNGTVKINNCFTTGNISGTNCQGLVASGIGSSSSANSTGGLYITNSYTLGNVTNITGEEDNACSGFIGEPATLDDDSLYQNIYISNVYVAGKIDKNSYPIVPPSIEKTLPFYSFYYAANGNWNDCEANKRLDPDTIPNKANNNIWIDINKHSNNVPYRLGSFNNFTYIYNKNNYFIDNGVLNNTRFNISYYNTNLVENQKYTLKYDVKVIDCVKPSCNLLNYNCIGFKTTGNKLLSIETKEYPIKYFDVEILKNNKINKSMKFKQSDIEKYSWPVYVNNNDKCKKLLLQLDSNLTLEGQDKYFIINGNNIKVDGKGYDIIIKDTLGYQGIFRNINNSNITIENIKTSSVGLSGLARYSGVTGQVFFGNGVNNKNNTINNIMNDMDIDNVYCGGVLGRYSIATITNCSNTGDINGFGTGGIVGNSFNGTITNCSNTGDINGEVAGGIAGVDFANNKDIISLIDNCSNTGNISGSNSGGIQGGYFFRKVDTNPQSKIINCFNSGLIIGAYGGGIVGTTCLISINSCKNTGDINGIDAGGICGDYFGYLQNNLSITNCSNTGNITGERAGGIVGSDANNEGNNLSIENCSNTGDINGDRAGGITGDLANNFGDNFSVTNCSNTGDINGDRAGGITGRFANREGDNFSIENCSNTGDINGLYTGGITGYGVYNLSMEKCSNTGDITGDGAGGILGTAARGQTTISNCFNIGNVTGNESGGITGKGLGVYGGFSDIIFNINNCYSKSSVTGTNANGIIAPLEFNGFPSIQNINVNNCYTLNGIISSDSTNPLVTITNSYEPMGTWNDSVASSTLVGGPVPPSLVGEVWTDPSGTTTDTPWNLTNNPE
jgi:hypothetical protein